MVRSAGVLLFSATKVPKSALFQYAAKGRENFLRKFIAFTAATHKVGSLTHLTFGAITDSENRKHLTFSVGLLQTFRNCNRLVIAVLKAKLAFFFGFPSTWALSQHSKFVRTLSKKKEQNLTEAQTKSYAQIRAFRE